MKFIFAGTTEFGIPSIEKLMQAGHELLFCITNPDKPTGRKQVLSPTPIKKWAGELNVKVLQPEKISTALEDIQAANADIMLVAAYGQIIPKEVFEAPKFGSINIHASILPRYRGASPIQTAILNGEETTGVTLIKMNEKMDQGPMLDMTEFKIENRNFLEVYKDLAVVAADLCVEVLPKYVAGELRLQEQAHAQASYTKKLSKTDGKIDWTKTAPEIYNQIRALNPEPGTWSTLDGKVVKILDAHVLEDPRIELPGKISKNSGLIVKTGSGSLKILKVQPEGKNVMSGQDFINGIKNFERRHFV